MRLRIFLLCLAIADFGIGASAAPAPTGYVTITFGLGTKFAANPLKVPDNRVAKLFPQPPEGTELYTFSNGKYWTNRFSSGAWMNPDANLEPGEGMIVYNPSAKQFAAVFQGEIPTGNLANNVPRGLSLKSSMVPQVGEVTTTLGLRLAPFDNVYLWKANRFEVYTLLPNGSWFPAEPSVNIGESFFIRANQQTTWIRVFTIN